MTVSSGKLLLFVAIYLLEKAQAQDNFGIVEPFPENIYPVEFTSAQVTCVAFDSTGVKTPDRIQFKRKSNFAIYTNLTANENLYFTTRTELEEVVGPDGEAKMATKLFVTLHIRNVTRDDDSQKGPLGRYECHAFAVNDTVEKKHGFTVHVISKLEIPTVSVDPRPSVVHHGHNITITCNFTEGQGSATPLKTVSWYKDGVKRESVRCPDLRDPDGFVGPLVLSNIGVRDGGNYTCFLEVLLRNKKKYHVSDTTVISIAPWFDKPQKDLQFKKRKGGSVSFVCAAQGFPLEVEWLVEKIEDDMVFPATCITASDGKYHIERRGIYDPYVLTVSNLQYSDNGAYYCCVSTNCSSDLPTGDLCQRFRLQVNGQSPPCQIHKAYLFAMLVLSMITIYERSEL